MSGFIHPRFPPLSTVCSSMDRVFADSTNKARVKRESLREAAFEYAFDSSLSVIGGLIKTWRVLILSPRIS